MLSLLATILVPFAASFVFFHNPAQGANLLPPLSCFIVVPIIAAFLIIGAPEKFSRWISLFFASLELGIGVKVFLIFQSIQQLNATPGFQLVEEVPWLKNFGINY